jgi:hypothetical protein
MPLCSHAVRSTSQTRCGDRCTTPQSPAAPAPATPAAPQAASCIKSAPGGCGAGASQLPAPLPAAWLAARPPQSSSSKPSRQSARRASASGGAEPPAQGGLPSSDAPQSCARAPAPAQGAELPAWGSQLPAWGSLAGGALQEWWPPAQWLPHSGCGPQRPPSAPASSAAMSSRMSSAARKAASIRGVRGTLPQGLPLAALSLGMPALGCLHLTSGPQARARGQWWRGYCARGTLEARGHAAAQQESQHGCIGAARCRRTQRRRSDAGDERRLRHPACPRWAALHSPRPSSFLAPRLPPLPAQAQAAVDERNAA